MAPLAEHLGEHGFQVFNLSYASRELPPEALVANLAEQVSSCCSEAHRVHFVTHSLGGILVRAYLVQHELSNLGRVVMLAPPNQGSELVDLLDDHEATRKGLGPSGTQLGTGPEALPRSLPPPTYEVGVIAGTRNYNPAVNAVLDAENDGTVSVASTKLEGMTDFVEVKASHTFIMRSPEVATYTVHFLQTGRFVEAEAD